MRLTGRQCDQKLGVGDQKLRTGHQQATNLSSHRLGHSKVKGLFLKENIKLPWTVVVKQSDDFRTAIFTWRHIVLAASPNTDIAGESMTWRDPARSKASALNPYYIQLFQLTLSD